LRKDNVMSLSPSQIDSIAKQIYRQFPEVKNARPSVQNQPTPKTAGVPNGQFLLTFKGQGKGPGGKTIPRIVRVVADTRGKVLKISTSR
jgi:hypothetical protein